MYDLDLQVVDRRFDEPVGPRELPLSVEDVAMLVGHALVVADVPDGVIEGGVEFVSVEAIAELNAEHRGIAGPTDVLSFPIDEMDELADGMPRQLGDVVVCPAYVADQVADGTTMVTDDAGVRGRDGDLRAALARCVVHGTLHVLGFDHERGADASAEMFSREEHALASWREGVDGGDGADAEADA